MKFSFKKYDEYQHFPTLTIGKLTFDFRFDWVDFLSKKAWENNWQCFYFAEIFIEREGCLGNWNGAFVVMGIGFRWNFQYAPFEESKEGKIICERLEDLKSGKAKTIPLDDAIDSMKFSLKEKNDVV